MRKESLTGVRVLVNLGTVYYCFAKFLEDQLRMCSEKEFLHSFLFN